MKRLFLLCAALLLAVNLYGADVRLAWDVHTDTSVTGYKVYWGNSTRNYAANASVTGRTNATYTVTGLGSGAWYFAVTALAPGIESGFSNEVTTTVQPPPPTNLTITNVTASSSRWSTIIQWTTNLPATEKVYLGLSPTDLTPAWSGSGFYQNHSVTLQDLTRKRTYYYRVESAAQSGDPIQSAVFSFRTP